MDEEELLRRAASGDRDAFCKLYEITRGPMYGYIFSIVHHPQDAEEILQDAYLKIWTAAGNYEPQGKPLAWMFTVARNLCYMYLRTRRHEVDLSYEELAEGGRGEACMPLEGLPERILLQKMLENLKEDERGIVLLHAAEGLKHREIAEAFGLPRPTVLSKYSRAVKKLRRMMEEEE